MEVNWKSIGGQLEVNLEVDWKSIGSQLQVNWKSIGRQLEVNWKSIGGQLDVNLEVNWRSIIWKSMTARMCGITDVFLKNFGLLMHFDALSNGIVDFSLVLIMFAARRKSIM